MIRLHVWGDNACFTRPEIKVERVTYDVITPSAARGIFEAIYWKPQINWVIDRIEVLQPIRFESIRRNEVASKVSASRVAGAMKKGTTENLYMVVDEGKERQQRAATILRNVGYILGAYFEITQIGIQDDCSGKHLAIFNRRARRGQCYHQPYLGTREFPAKFTLLENGAQPSSTLLDSDKDKDLGWMLRGIDFDKGNTPHFFRAIMKNGVIKLPPLLALSKAGRL